MKPKYERELDYRRKTEPKWYIYTTIGWGKVEEYAYTKSEALKEADKILRSHDTVTITRNVI